MPQIPPIEDAYIDQVIKAHQAYNPNINKTQGTNMRELIKLLRDRLEQQIKSTLPDQAGNAGKVLTTDGIAANWSVPVLTADDIGLGHVDNTADPDKPVSTAQRAAIDAAAAQAVTNVLAELRDGVPASGNTLKKIFDLVLSQFAEVQVADRAARDAYDILHLPTNVFVADDGDGKWALYKATSTGIGANYVKLSDADTLNAAMSASDIKAAYESNPDTNAFTDALLAKLIGLPVGATENQPDAYLLNRSNHTGMQSISTISGLQTALDKLGHIPPACIMIDPVNGNDATGQRNSFFNRYRSIGAAVKASQAGDLLYCFAGTHITDGTNYTASDFDYANGYIGMSRYNQDILIYFEPLSTWNINGKVISSGASGAYPIIDIGSALAGGDFANGQAGIRIYGRPVINATIDYQHAALTGPAFTQVRWRPVWCRYTNFKMVVDFDFQEFNFKEINIDPATKPVGLGKAALIQVDSNNCYIDAVVNIHRFTADCFMFNLFSVNKFALTPDAGSHVNCVMEIDFVDVNYSVDEHATISASYMAPVAIVTMHDLMFLLKGREFVNRSPRNVQCLMHTTGTLGNIAKGYISIAFEQFRFMGEYPQKTPDVQWNGYSNPFSCGNGDTFVRIAGNIILDKAPHAFHTYGSYTEFVGNIQYSDVNTTPLSERRWHIKTNPAYGPNYAKKGSIYVRNISTRGLVTNGVDGFEILPNTGNVTVYGNADLIRQVLSAGARNAIANIQLFAASYHMDNLYSNAPLTDVLIQIEVQEGTDTITIPVKDKDGNVIRTITNEDMGKVLSFKVNPTTRSMVYEVRETLGGGAESGIRFRGEIDCYLNPDYPASDTGDRWLVTVGGKIGGNTGIAVAPYDEIVCKTASAGGSQATAGTDFYVVQGKLGNATETTAGAARIATNAQAVGLTNDDSFLTPLKGAALWDEKKKTVNYQINPVGLNEVSILMEHAGQVNEVLVSGANKVKLKAGITAGYPATDQVYPFHYAAGDRVFITYNYDDLNTPMCNIKLKCQDN